MEKGIADLIGLLCVIAGLVAIGSIIGGYVVWRQHRHRPTMHQLSLANHFFQRKSDDYKALCIDARSQAEALALLASAIHKSSPSESSEKIVRELDHFILKMNERLAAKQLTPAEGVDLC